MEDRTGLRSLDVRRLGVVGYAEALGIQEDLVERRRAGDLGDQLLLLEHPHVITLGSGSSKEHILVSAEERRARGIELFETGRGGDVTYHGPGQLVGYPVLDLKPDRRDLHRYLRDIEQVLIDVLAVLGLEAERSEGYTGVWVDDRKVAAIGVRVSSGWITSHGFALNVRPDLSFFSTIVPCGIQDRAVTSLQELLDRSVEVEEVLPIVEQTFARGFERDIRVVSTTLG